MAKAETVDLQAELPYREAAARTVTVRATEVFEHAEGVLDTSDIERVHDMRVATRRLRAAMEIFEPCFDAKLFRPVLRDVKLLADALGARRDPDVQLEQLMTIEAALGARERDGLEVFAEELRAEQAEGNARLSEALAQTAQEDLRGRLLALAENARR
jgi:CHAD domain-containing protein